MAAEQAQRGPEGRPAGLLPALACTMLRTLDNRVDPGLGLELTLDMSFSGAADDEEIEHFGLLSESFQRV
jgi:hypothetical protein